ncbi:gem-associated protein 2 isoform X2 [Diachasma alloeum]|uniref:gem-associated protein 2 isoform X2 n=1 Tax=Diachasma alloeum TaxID=454923 RepID=UPI00073815E1|nr:gem-associated protein 2 isoform X2 [Diachasma alloeum]
MNDHLKDPVLYVGDIDDNIDLSQPPMSGEDYIKRVVIEAQQCEDVVVARIDEARLKKPTVNVKTLGGCMEAPATLSPTYEWQKCQVDDFSEVRLNMSRIKAERENYRQYRRRTVEFPDVDDRTGWVNFCLGSSLEGSSPHLPTLDIIFCLSQLQVEQVLEYLIEEVETRGTVDPDIGQWIYGLLAVLELPLNPDVCSCLRTLARSCSIARANLKPEESEKVKTLNLFICLVARYFRQLDLADP